MKVQLVVVQGKPEGMTIPLASPRYKIGRGENCQLRPNSDLVSREHAEFSVSADSVIVQDLGSRNGTEVNGKRLAANQPQLLKTGDLIKVGTLTFAISIEGAAAAKPASVVAGGGGSRKKSLDDVSGDEIDAWLVSDESRPTPDRPSGVYGGDTVTLATYNGQEKDKPKAAASTPPPKPAPAATPTPPAPAPKPVAAPAPIAQSPAVAAAPAPAPLPPPPVVQAPPPTPPPVVQAPEPTLAPPPLPPPPVVQAAPAPPPKVEREEPSGFDKYFATLPDRPDAEETELNSESETSAESSDDDGIEDLSSFQDDDEGGDSAEAAPEEYIDESNPFYVKKTAETPAAATKPGVGSQDSSSAAGDILRKLMDRRRSSKS